MPEADNEMRVGLKGWSTSIRVTMKVPRTPCSLGFFVVTARCPLLASFATKDGADRSACLSGAHLER